MKTRISVVLFLCAVLALPAIAQQSSSPQASSSDQMTAASQVETATGREPLRREQTNFWDGDEPSIVWLVLHPFASKGYVQRNLDAIRDRVNELDELTSSNGKMIKDVDTRAQQGIQLASTKAEEADQHALDASNKAVTAQQTAATANTHVGKVETVVSTLDQYKAANQTVIRFHPGQTALSKQAKDALDEMATRLKDQRGYVIEVQGFSTSHGQAGIAASRNMADSVVRYLVLNHEIPAYRIYVLAMGNAPTAAEEGSHSRGNRVEVSFLKNDVDQLPTSASAEQPTQPK